MIDYWPPTAPDALKFFREVVELQRASKIDAPSMSAALAEIDILQRERDALLAALRKSLAWLEQNSPAWSAVSEIADARSAIAAATGEDGG